MATGQDNSGFDDITGEKDEEADQEEDGEDLASSSDTDDVSSDKDDFTDSVTTDEVETDISDADISENGITKEKKVSFKDTKQEQKRKENLLLKLESFRKPYISVLGKRWTCYNIRYFVGIFSVIVFLRSCISSYLHMVSHEIGERYDIDRYEMEFIIGVERIGVVISLMFTGYYGNKFFKPISVLCGAVLCGIGAIIVAVPYFILGGRETDTETTVPKYIEAGLCHAGAITNASYSDQCGQHPAFKFPEEVKGSFSLFCTAHFFIGIGTAFLLPGGIVYTVEAERSTENPLYMGLFFGAYGLGQLIGSLFGVWFITYPETLSGDISIHDWNTGAWWVGFLVFGPLLILVPFTLLVFPRWIREPRWLLYRKYRHKLRLERWKKREQEARRKRRQKKREKLKKERERKRIKEKQRTTAINDVDRSGTDTGESSEITENGSAVELDHKETSEVNNVTKDSNSNNSNISEANEAPQNFTDLSSETNNQDGISESQISEDTTVEAGKMPVVLNPNVEGRSGPDSGESNEITENDEAVELDQKDTSDVNNVTKGSNSNNTNRNDTNEAPQNLTDASSEINNQDTINETQISVEETSMEDGKMAVEINPSDSTSVIRNTSSSVERKPLYKKHSHGKQVRTSQTKTSSKEDSTDQDCDENLTPEQLKRKRFLEKNRQRHKLGRRLQDLPKNLKFLVKRPMFLITVLASGISLYFQAGFYPTLHRYFHVQFQYSQRDSLMIAGVVFGLGVLLGALVSSVVVFRFKLSLKKQFLYSLIVQAITLIMVLILMALGCEVQQGPTRVTDIGLQSSCATNCDCSVSQLSRVCSRDGSVSYLTPCHAGCKVAHVDQESSNNLHYTECTCELSLEVAPEWCETRCNTAAGFIICCLVAVITQSMAFVTVLLVMIKSQPEKLRSLNIGFSFWIIYIIAVVPGVAVYTYFYTTSCTLYGINCQEKEECWSSDVTKYRYITTGATLAFVAVGLALFVGAYFVFLKVNRTSDTKTSTDSDPKNSATHLTPNGKEKPVDSNETSKNIGASKNGFSEQYV